MGHPGTDLDLAVIDQAFGDFADLYSDVLRVSVVATHEQIQLAYFDRRSELFTLLAKIDAKPQDEETVDERFIAERRMDSVVLAVRILGDPEQRLQYDRMRQERLLNRRRAQHGQLPGHDPNDRVSAALDSIEDDQHKRRKPTTSATTTSVTTSGRRKERRERSTEPVRNDPKPVVAETERRPKKKRNKRVVVEQQPEEPDPVDVQLNQSRETNDTAHLTDEESRPDLDRSLVTLDTEETRQDDTVVSFTTAELDAFTVTSRDFKDGDEQPSGGVLSCLTESRFIRKISSEISGACEDTIVSVDQVFNAFTLTDKDIRAVTKRIDKAKRQLET